jgi:hypothetical protein
LLTISILLASKYAEMVTAAGDGPLRDPGALVVAIVRDGTTGRFRLPPIVQVFVEWKAQEGDSSSDAQEDRVESR